MSASFNYGEVLQKSFLFYEAQRSGDLPPDNRIAWREDSALNDGSTVGRDLSGGYYDAGDHMKFVFPMAGAMTMLGWGLLEYQDGYIQSNQYDEALDALKWGTDWLLKAHETDAQGTTAFWMQVGDADDDYSVWIPSEDLENAGSPLRPAFKLDRQTPGSDLAAEVAAALAAASIVFRPHDEAYADELLENSIQLYDFADDADLNASNGKQRGKYSDALHQLAPSIFSSVDETTGDLNYYGYYNSWSGYPDELLWGATWLHKAQAAGGVTNNQYLALAEHQYQQTYFNATWTHSWDDKSQGAAILLAQLTKNQDYRDDVERWLNRWLPKDPGATPGNDVDYTPGGLAVLSPWGSLRYSANTAFLAGIYADTVLEEGPDSQLIEAYEQFAKQQIDYVLGDNAENFSYVVGFGDNYPLQPHHRGASGITGYGSDFNDSNLPNAHILYGALVGGPQSVDDKDYNDSRTDFVTNEVALDYNAAFTGAVARLYQEYGGEPIRDGELDNLPDNEDYITYLPHLQVSLDGTIANLAITDYGSAAQNLDPQLNIFLDKTAQIIGNGWKKLAIDYNITPRTILKFDFNSAVKGKIQGLGFDSNNIISASDSTSFFQLAGSQQSGLNKFNNYEIGNGWRSYSIQVSDFFTGNFKYLILGNEHDISNVTAESQFRNIELLETQAPTAGTPSKDTFTGSSDNDSFEGLAGNDVFISSLGNDLLDGGLGVDRVDYATSSVNGVRVDLAAGYVHKGGGAGDTLVNIENIFGSNRNDTLTGDALNNRLIGRAGNDVIHGSAGNDILRGGVGADELDGGLGIDTVDYGGSTQGVIVDLSNNSASGGDATGDILSGFERIFGSNRNDTLTGDALNNRLIGRAGNDVIHGSAGNDILRGGAGADELDGGLGLDTVDYGGSTQGVIVDLSNNSASGGDATGDIISGFERIYGSNRKDTLTGDESNNLIFGRSGNDVLHGGAGNDRLRGDAGNDSLTGGIGVDRFEYLNTTFGMDTIADFEIGKDKIVFRSSGLMLGSFTVTQQSGNTLLELSANRSNTILLIGVNAVSINDFVI